MNDPGMGDWEDLNRQALVTELARIKALLAGDAAPAHAAPRAASPAAIDVLAERFALSPFERDLLLLAAGVEMDTAFGPLCAAVPSAGAGPWASFALALAVLPQPHWDALTPAGPLRRWRLIELAADGALVNARLRIDERVLHYLAGVNYLDTRLAPVLRAVDPPVLMADAQRATAQAIAARLQASAPVIHLWGNDPDGARDVAASVAAACGMRLYVLAAEDIPGVQDEVDALAALWEREALLLDGALLVACADAATPAARRLAARLAGLAMLAAREPAELDCDHLCYRVDKPDRHDRLALWERALGGGRADGALRRLAWERSLSAREIERAGAGLAGRAPGSDLPWQACREHRPLRLDGLARRIEARAGWQDLILSETHRLALRQIAAQVRHQVTVHEDWGFAAKSARGLGISALFAGESGTGKTMAAEVLARELELDLYCIDLSALVSKYIGETEKNLARVFDAGEESGAILLFDEADALFGKRGEVKDSRDRYANIEVSYLLQRMESYRGLAILTSNQKAALDGAFHRRLRFVIDFPFPGAAEREAIWRRVFPPGVPLDGIDYRKLAQLNMAGGHIRSIALNAAFYAAQAGTPVGMAHLLRAAHGEAVKRGRPITEHETRGWT